MIDRLISYYHKKTYIMKLKTTYKTIFRGLLRYLSEFIDYGKSWALKRSYDSPEEYLYTINLRCGKAKYLMNEADTILKGLLKYANDHIKSTPFIERTYQLFISIRELLKESITVVPYTKLDEFNQYVYDSEMTIKNQIINQPI